MEFFQEQALTAVLAIVLCYLVAKIFSFAVSSSIPDRDTVDFLVNEIPVGKEGILSKGLRVKKGKSIRRVKFVDEDVIKRVGIDEGSAGKMIAEKKSAIDEKVEMLTENESSNGNEICGGFGVEETTLGCSKPKSLILDLDQQKNDVIVGSDEMGTHTRDEIERLGSGETEAVITKDVKEEMKIEKEKNRVIDAVLDSGENAGVAADTVEEKDDRNESAGDGDEDWEDIERSELEKVFAEGVNYVEYGGKGKEVDREKISKLDSDVQMQLYGLHKVAVEGPCHESQPMALMVSARAKWNAWQRMGSISQETAMEQYIRLLSDSIPDWRNDCAADDDLPDSKLETEDKAHPQENNRNLVLSDNLKSNV